MWNVIAPLYFFLLFVQTEIEYTQILDIQHRKMYLETGNKWHWENPEHTDFCLKYRCDSQNLRAQHPVQEKPQAPVESPWLKPPDFTSNQLQSEPLPGVPCSPACDCPRSTSSEVICQTGPCCPSPTERLPCLTPAFCPLAFNFLAPPSLCLQHLSLCSLLWAALCWVDEMLPGSWKIQ